MKDEIEDALPGATGFREKRTLLRSQNHGIGQGNKGSYILPVGPQEYGDRLPLEDQSWGFESLLERMVMRSTTGGKVKRDTAVYRQINLRKPLVR